jgi:hypothetical protein
MYERKQTLRGVPKIGWEQILRQHRLSSALATDLALNLVTATNSRCAAVTQESIAPVGYISRNAEAVATQRTIKLRASVLTMLRFF